MSSHCDEELVGLLSGELNGDETRAVVAHLRECGECTSALISVAASHGALRAARRSIAVPSSEVTPAAGEAAEELPPLVMRRRWSNQLIGSVAAALVLIAAVSLGLAISSRTPAPVATASLHNLDAPVTTSGLVTVQAASQEFHMHVVTVDLPAAPRNYYYEVWLLEPSTNKMLPLGLLSSSGNGDFTISKAIMGQFSAVDISLQKNDGDPEHSSVSVLRGTVVSA